MSVSATANAPMVWVTEGPARPACFDVGGSGVESSTPCLYVFPQGLSVRWMRLPVCPPYWLMARTRKKRLTVEVP